MTEENATPQPRRKSRKILKGFAFGLVIVAAILTAAHFAWKYSGSNEWKPELDKNGIQIFSKKIPGSTVKAWRAVRRLKITLNGAVAAMMSTDNEDCKAWGTVSVRSIRAWNPHDLSYIHLYRVNVPAPFSPLDMAIEAHASQDPRSKAVLIKFAARPDTIPEEECCVRVAVYDATWRFTPVGNGDVEVELQAYGEPPVPYFMVNAIQTRSLYATFTKLPKLLLKEKWRNARFEGIQEP